MIISWVAHHTWPSKTARVHVLMLTTPDAKRTAGQVLGPNRHATRWSEP